MQPCDKLLVLGAVAYEAGIELDRLQGPDERGDLSDEGIRHAAAEEEGFGNFTLRLVDRIDG
jgi:hypothetical protein